jgi:NADH-quinone oxidoreductase subunit J
MAAVLMGGFRPAEPGNGAAVVQAGQVGTAAAAQVSNTKELGKLLYSHYLYPLEIAAVVLLVAIVAAIALTLRQRKDSKHMDPGLQVRVRASDRLQVIKMPPVVAAPPQPEPAVAAAAEGGKA